MANNLPNRGKLDSLGDTLFFLGFFLNKASAIPFVLASLIITILALSIYVLAYAVWFASSLIYHRNTSYKQLANYKQFKQHLNQYLLSSAVGLCATVIGITALFFPYLAIPAAALFLISNIVWTVGEYYRLQISSETQAYGINYQAQQAYIKYAIITTAVSVITLTAAVLCVIFPPSALLITSLTLILGTLLGCFAGIKWTEAKFINIKCNDNKDGDIQDSSYQTMLKRPKNELPPQKRNQDTQQKSIERKQSISYNSQLITYFPKLATKSQHQEEEESNILLIT